eukprot:1481842-Pyramimonas_sp.AAC.1
MGGWCSMVSAAKDIGLTCLRWVPVSLDSVAARSSTEVFERFASGSVLSIGQEPDARGACGCCNLWSLQHAPRCRDPATILWTVSDGFGAVGDVCLTCSWPGGSGAAGYVGLTRGRGIWPDVRVAPGAAGDLGLTWCSLCGRGSWPDVRGGVGWGV